jgi:hypothetical protein
MNKHKFISTNIVIINLLIFDACERSFLEITPSGALDKAVLSNYDGVDALLIGAYSMLDGVGTLTSSGVVNSGWAATTSGWLFGSIRGIEANRGGDSGEIGLMERYGEIFDIEHRNDIEAVYIVQYAVNDG